MTHSRIHWTSALLAIICLTASIEANALAQRRPNPPPTGQSAPGGTRIQHVSPQHAVIGPGASADQPQVTAVEPDPASGSAQSSSAVSPAGGSSLSPEEQELADRYLWRIQKTLGDVRSMQPPCNDCDAYMAGHGNQGPRQCPNDHKNVFNNGKSEVDMRVVLGYMDYLNDTDDIYASAALIEQLTSACLSPSHGACGFERDPDDAELFYKTVTGPDGNPKRVRLQIVSSSASGSERLNRNELKAVQEQRTRHAEEVFYSGLSSADAVMYIGHSRNGGGPDFGPPRINPQTRRTDLPWYEANRTSLRRMVSALQSSPSPAAMVGLFSCFSREKFGSSLRGAAPNTGFVLAGENDFESGVGQAIATIDSMLTMRCESEFKEAVNSVKEVWGYPVGPVSVDGYFKK